QPRLQEVLQRNLIVVGEDMHAAADVETEHRHDIGVEAELVDEQEEGELVVEDLLQRRMHHALGTCIALDIVDVERRVVLVQLVERDRAGEESLAPPSRSPLTQRRLPAELLAEELTIVRPPALLLS